MTAYERIVEAAPTAIVAVDESGRIAFANGAAEALFGCSRRELVGRDVETLLPERLRGERLFARSETEGGRRVLAGGDSRDLWILRSDGREVPVEIGRRPVQLEDGSHILATIVDISERKRVEERLRLAVDASPTAMVMIDEGGFIVLVNAQAETLFGYTRDELVGRRVEVLIPPNLRADHPRFRASFMADPHTRSMGGGRDLFCLRKDGSEVPVEIGLNPLHTPEGTFVLSSVIDITSRKRAEAEREELLERERAALLEARAANYAKDEFLALLSHELRTPLNAILGWANLLRSERFNDEETDQALETIERNARHQTRIVSEILDVSRIIRGKFALEIGPCDLRAVVESVLNNLQPALRAKGLRLRSRLSAVRALQLDAGRLEQAIWNLVSNAIKFTPRGGRVDVELLDEGSEVIARVRDSGEGFPPEFSRHIFERFTQADSSSTRAHGGLGLGLAISRHLVELHGGTIVAESAGTGSGACFTLRLPVSATASTSPPEARSVEPEPEEEVVSSSVLTGLRLLVVDDEPDTRELLLTSLTRFGATVLTAGSVSEAMALVEEFRPDLVVSDIAMPGEDGFSLLRRLREEAPPPSARVPVVALTAYAGAENRRALLAAGFNVHVPKPIEPMRFATLIAQVARGYGEGLH